jgi:hypothetical protein
MKVMPEDGWSVFLWFTTLTLISTTLSEMMVMNRDFPRFLRRERSQRCGVEPIESEFITDSQKPAFYLAASPDWDQTTHGYVYSFQEVSSSSSLNIIWNDPLRAWLRIWNSGNTDLYFPSQRITLLPINPMSSLTSHSNPQPTWPMGIAVDEHACINALREKFRSYSIQSRKFQADHIRSRSSSFQTTFTSVCPNALVRLNPRTSPRERTYHIVTNYASLIRVFELWWTGSVVPFIKAHYSIKTNRQSQVKLRPLYAS